MLIKTLRQNVFLPLLNYWMSPLQPASLPFFFLSGTRRLRNAIKKQCEPMKFAFAAYCKGGENFFNCSIVLFKRFMIGNRQHQQYLQIIFLRFRSDLIRHCSIKGLWFSVNSALSPYKSIFNNHKYFYKSRSRWKDIIVSLAMRRQQRKRSSAMAATNGNISVATREFRDSSIMMPLSPD